MKLGSRHWLIFLVSAMALSTGVAHAAIRSAPVRPIVIATPDLSVVLDPLDGLPYQYRFGNYHIWGEDSGFRMTAIVCRIKPRLYSTITLTPTSSKVGKSDVSFSFQTTYQGQPAASFDLKYSLNGASLTLSMEQVREQSGFELIEVSIPDLATVREEDGSSWLAHGNDGGSVVDLSHSKSYRVPENRFFGKIAAVLPVAMVGSGPLAAALEVNAFMNGMPMEIAGERGHRHARIGTVETYRVHGGRAYEMNNLGPPVAGDENTSNSWTDAAVPAGLFRRCRR